MVGHAAGLIPRTAMSLLVSWPICGRRGDGDICLSVILLPALLRKRPRLPEKIHHSRIGMPHPGLLGVESRRTSIGGGRRSYEQPAELILHVGRRC